MPLKSEILYKFLDTKGTNEEVANNISELQGEEQREEAEVKEEEVENKQGKKER